MFSINRVTLIGFLGKNAEVRHTYNNESAFTVLSLATNRSWKDRESGEYKSDVSWHRCVAFGRAGEYAATLLKGAQVQVEGEIRTREYAEKSGGKKPTTVKKTITEIRVYRIAKLDRPSKAGTESSAPGTEVPA
jgi:single-strand DNA-binding protein